MEFKHDNNKIYLGDSATITKQKSATVMAGRR